MTLRVVGAGWGRTGTLSLKIALEQLLGAPCYHMVEVFEHFDHVPVWARAVQGEAVEWSAIYDGYAATVDWPSTACWEQIAAAYPDAKVLLSTRDFDGWWASATQTIFESAARVAQDPNMAEWAGMVATFLPPVDDREAAHAAYDAHNSHVRDTVPRDRLIDWMPGDGWAPICTALDLPIPSEPFPHANTTAEFRETQGLDA